MSARACLASRGAALVFAAPRLVTRRLRPPPPSPLPSLFRRLTGDLCDEINADQKRSCAVSATIKATDLYPTNGVLYEYMNAIIAATPEGDSDQCPTLGNLVPYFSGEHGTDDDNPYHNAREDNSSHAPVFDP